MTFAEDGRTMTGSRPGDVAERLSDLGLEVIGANCSVGPQRILPVIEAMRRRLDARTGRQPALASAIHLLVVGLAG